MYDLQGGWSHMEKTKAWALPFWGHQFLRRFGIPGCELQNQLQNLITKFYHGVWKMQLDLTEMDEKYDMILRCHPK